MAVSKAQSRNKRKTKVKPAIRGKKSANISLELKPKGEPKLAGNTTSARVIQAARRHFLAHGLRTITMEELARELGISKKTIYAEFASKEALLQAVLEDKFRDVEADFKKVTARSATDFMAALKNLLACLQKHSAEIQAPLIRDIKRDVPEMFEIVERNRRTIIKRYFGKLFNDGRKVGIVRKDIPASLIVEILLGATQTIMNPARMIELNLTPKMGYAAIVSVVLTGAITEKGRRKL